MKKKYTKDEFNMRKAARVFARKISEKISLKAKEKNGDFIPEKKHVKKDK